MKNTKIKLIAAAAIIIIVILIILGQLFRNSQLASQQQFSEQPTPEITTQISQAKIITSDLNNPDGLVMLPDNSILVIERKGIVRYIDRFGNLRSTPAVVLPQVKSTDTVGLLGITLHPDYLGNHYVYLYYTYSVVRSDTLSRVVRMTLSQYQLVNEKIILDNIPGTLGNPGGRIAFGPDRFLYIGTGDTDNPSRAQDTNSIVGKILRLIDDGRQAPGNPFNNLVFSLGQSNPRGITWDRWGNLIETEASGANPAGYDEINLVQSGVNYGWPLAPGQEYDTNIAPPLKISDSIMGWQPSGAVLIGSSLFFGGLKDDVLYEAVLEDLKVKDFKEHFGGKYGKITDVARGSDNLLYFIAGDKIISINPIKINE